MGLLYRVYEQLKAQFDDIFSEIHSTCSSISLYINIKDTVNLLTDDYYDTPTVIILKSNSVVLFLKQSYFDYLQRT